MHTMIDQKQLEKVECFNYLHSMINYARQKHEIKYRVSIAKAAFKKKKSISTSRLDRNLGKKLMKCYITSISFYGAGEGWRRSSEYVSVTNEEILL